MFKVLNKDTRATLLTSFWLSLLLAVNIFQPFPDVYIVDFEQLNFCWIEMRKQRCI